MLLGLLALPPAVARARRVLGGADRPGLIRVLARHRAAAGVVRRDGRRAGPRAGRPEACGPRCVPPELGPQLLAPGPARRRGRVHLGGEPGPQPAEQEQRQRQGHDDGDQQRHEQRQSAGHEQRPRSRATQGEHGPACRGRAWRRRRPPGRPRRARDGIRRGTAPGYARRGGRARSRRTPESSVSPFVLSLPGYKRSSTWASDVTIRRVCRSRHSAVGRHPGGTLE